MVKIIKLRNKHSGFVLYEAAVALMITIMILGILQQSLQILHNIQKTTFRDQVRWHINQEKLQDVLGDSQIARVYDDRIIYKRSLEDRKMVLGKYNHFLRIENATGGGFVPVMKDLNKINFEKFDNLVIITTVNKAGQKSQMCIIVDS